MKQKKTQKKVFAAPRLLMSGMYDIGHSKGCMKYPSKCGAHTHTS